MLIVSNSLFIVFTVYSYKVVLVYFAVVTHNETGGQVGVGGGGGTVVGISFIINSMKSLPNTFLDRNMLLFK